MCVTSEVPTSVGDSNLVFSSPKPYLATEPTHRNDDGDARNHPLTLNVLLQLRSKTAYYIK